MGWMILLVLLTVFVGLPIVIYNRLVARKNEYLNAFAQVQVQLKRRYDLIPNLVEAAKAYLVHESGTLEAVVRARSSAEKSLEAAAASPNTAALDSLMQQESLLSGALKNLNVVMEAYPELKAAATVADLTESLETTENRVGFARQAYNYAVTDYNVTRQSFPASLLQTFLGTKKMQYHYNLMIRPRFNMRLKSDFSSWFYYAFL